jgi:hypothetical protein
MQQFHNREDRMQKIWCMAISAVFIAGCAMSAYAADLQGAVIGRYGIYQSDVTKKEPAAKAAAGYKTVSENIVFMLQTDKIMAAAGTKFGFEYIIQGSPEGDKVDLMVKYLHPPMTNPASGKTFAGQDIITEQRTIGGPELIGYEFDEAWEIVPGQWTIQLFYGDKKLAEKTFQIIKK